MQRKKNERKQNDRKLSSIIQSQQGFTLVELLVVICLISILFGFFMRCFVFVIQQYHDRITFLELQDNLAIAMDWIISDAEKSMTVLDCNETQLSLQYGSEKVYYNLGTDQQANEHFYDLEGKILYRRESTQWNRQPIANFISQLYVIYYDDTGDITEQAGNVAAIEVQLLSCWKEKEIMKRQIVSLKDSNYL